MGFCVNQILKYTLHVQSFCFSVQPILLLIFNRLSHIALNKYIIYIKILFFSDRNSLYGKRDIADRTQIPKLLSFVLFGK